MLNNLINTHFKPIVSLDFTAKNTDLQHINLANTADFNEYIFGKLLENNSKIGIGGYFEHRVIYRRSEHFNRADSESRSIHLGIDIWTTAETEVYTPQDGIVHSFADNNNFGDYGPTIILEHQIEGKTFFSLYGHLSRKSLIGIYEGKIFRKGDLLAWIGHFPENGDWPPHLHFQVMNDMCGMKGDFAGVCAISEVEKYRKICLNPMEFLKL
ncbi:MAG: peptidoglycan DD-metalloendopeptidase family protein [Spirosomaceae bacterium]|nr:peptidoglycan DD-metalloendopeptidase family protein [Spirosomataceae bacterium]